MRQQIAARKLLGKGKFWDEVSLKRQFALVCAYLRIGSIKIFEIRFQGQTYLISEDIRAITQRISRAIRKMQNGMNPIRNEGHRQGSQDLENETHPILHGKRNSVPTGT